MSNLRYTLNGSHLTPAIDGISRTEETLRDTLDMAAGNRRHYIRATVRRVSWSLSYPGADEDTWAIWKAAAQAAQAAAVTLTEPDGTAYSVVCTAFDDPVVNSAITSGSGTTSAVGTVERDLTITLESL